MTVVNFAGKNIKWNNADDARDIREEILSTENLTCLVLEGNTLGIEAAKEIGEALAEQPSFERAHWKDLFTGRLKDEIPQALKNLFSGVNKSGAKLKELDLSDNALGPVGVEGITEFLKSPSCYSLEELRLNNNGLGIKGGTMLAEALLELSRSAREAGTPLHLKVFIAGRNRLENEGAKKFAEVFSDIKSLEEVAMPQNGIFHEGIAALAKALSLNPNLRILNLNDNTFTYKGAHAIADLLPSMQNLEIINFGDCLLKTPGVCDIASALREGHTHLRVLHLDSNEIRLEGAVAVIEAVKNKDSVESLVLGGNQFGERGCMEIAQLLKKYNKEAILGSLEDDEEPCSDDEEEEEEDHDEEEDVSINSSQTDAMSSQTTVEPIQCTVEEFVNKPTAAHFLGINGSVSSSLVEEARRRAALQPRKDYLMPNSVEAFINECIYLFMTTASLLTTNNNQVTNLVKEAVKELLRSAFECAKPCHLESLVTNGILVHFGLMKSENKQFKIMWDLKGGLMALPDVLKESFFTSEAKSTLQFFFSRPALSVEQFSAEKHQVMKALFTS